MPKLNDEKVKFMLELIVILEMYWVEIPMYNVFTKIIEAYDSISKNPGFEELNIP